MDKKKCGNCGNSETELKICSSCLEVSYCNRECQMKHLHIHKPRCTWDIAFKGCAYCGIQITGPPETCDCRLRNYCSRYHKHLDYESHKELCDSVVEFGLVGLSDVKILSKSYDFIVSGSMIPLSTILWLIQVSKRAKETSSPYICFWYYISTVRALAVYPELAHLNCRRAFSSKLFTRNSKKDGFCEVAEFINTYIRIFDHSCPCILLMEMVLYNGVPSILKLFEEIKPLINKENQLLLVVPEHKPSLLLDMIKNLSIKSKNVAVFSVMCDLVTYFSVEFKETKSNDRCSILSFMLLWGINLFDHTCQNGDDDVGVVLIEILCIIELFMGDVHAKPLGKLRERCYNGLFCKKDSPNKLEMARFLYRSFVKILQIKQSVEFDYLKKSWDEECLKMILDGKTPLKLKRCLLFLLTFELNDNNLIDVEWDAIEPIANICCPIDKTADDIDGVLDEMIWLYRKAKF